MKKKFQYRNRTGFTGFVEFEYRKTGIPKPTGIANTN